jgi:type IV pilus assembly protein PilM
MSKRSLGIDIGYDTLKLALVSGKQVQKTAIASMPKRLMRDGRIVSPEAMGELIRNTMRENGIRCSSAAFSFSSEAVFVRNVTIPVMSADQLIYNLPYEFRDYITDELKNYIFDYAMLTSPKEEKKAMEAMKKADKQAKDKQKKKKQNALEAFTEEQESGTDTVPSASASTETLGDASDTAAQTMELLAVAAPISLMEETQLILRKAGLKLVKAAPSVCSYISMIRNMDDENRPESGEYCFLDLGYQAIRMYMFKGTRHEVTRALEFGLSRIDDALADAYNVDVHLAHTYLLTNYEDCQSKDVCLNAFNGIAVELMRALNFYRFSNPDSNLSDIWLCGGGAAIAPLCQVISEGLDNLKLRYANELLPAGMSIEEGNSLIQAIGIAQY